MIMFNRRALTTLTAVTALAGGTIGSAAASAETLAPAGLGNASIGSVVQNEQAKIAGLSAVIAAANTPVSSLGQDKQANLGSLSNATLGSMLQSERAKAAALHAVIQARPPICRAWRVTGQTFFADQGSYTLMFTLRMAPSPSTRFSGFAEYWRGANAYNGHAVARQYIGGGIGPDGSVHMDIVWNNGTSGQYNATLYGVQQTSSGGLTGMLQGTAVDTTGTGGGSAMRWTANGTASSDGFTADTTLPMYCPPSAVTR
jgi:hypothetical protein